MRASRELPARILRKTFDGVVSAGRAYGGHFHDADTIRVRKQIGVNDKGVWEVEIDIRDPRTGNWVAKHGRTTLFPLKWSRAKVMYEARMALVKAKQHKGNVWAGVSPSGVTIEFVRESNGEIISFYPRRKSR